MSKKSFGTRTIIALILLLGISSNFALTSLAQVVGAPAGPTPPSGLANAGTGASAPTSPTAGSTSPTSGSTSAPSGLANAGTGASTGGGGTSAPSGLANAGTGAATGAGASSTPSGLANAGSSSLAVQVAEQQAGYFSWLDPLMTWITGSSNSVNSSTGNPEADSVYTGVKKFWNSTGSAFFENLGQLIKQYVKQLVMKIVEPIIQALTALLVQFAYNPDVSVGKDQFSTQVQNLANTIQLLANDLLLLFFILSIWRYWANAAWKGGSMMGAVARIIVAAGAMTAWPTIYHYVILISNALTQYLLNNNTLNPTVISNAVANAISTIVNGQATISFVNSILNSSAGGGGVTTAAAAVVGGTIVAIFQLILVIAIGLAIIGSFIVFFTMKVIQIVIVVAAFPFAPFFLCLLVSPDTDKVVSGFIRSFIETSLWTFVWTIFLMLFIFALGVNPSGADYNGTLTVSQNPQNPWFVLFLELGILQAMIQTPGYLSRGKISEAGEFLELYGIYKLGKAAGNMLFGADGYVSKAFRHAKRNNPFKKDEASMSLGGANALPGGGKQLASLNQHNKTGAASVAGNRGALPGTVGGARLASLSRTTTPGLNMPATPGLSMPTDSDQPLTDEQLVQLRAATKSAMTTGGGSTGINRAGSQGGTPTGISSTAALGGGLLGSTILAANRSALSQFSSSVGGGYQGASGNLGEGMSAVQKTSLGLQSDANPWHDTRGRRMNAVDYLAAYNLGSIRPGKVAFTKNTKNPHENSIDFDDAGVIRKLNHRDGASAQEEGMMGTVAALATLPYSDGRGHPDARALTATNSAVKDKGKWDAPLGRRISYALSGGRVPEYVRNLEKDRLEREKTKARIEGSMAYVKGESGNAYTKFLAWKLDGPMDDGMRSMLAYTSENTDASLGGFNLNLDSGIQRLGRMGMDINPVTIGIASHDGVIAMKPSEQPQAIPAVLQLVNAHLATMGIDPSNKAIWNQSPLHWAAADGVLRSISPQHIRAARAIADIQGLSAVSPQSVNGIMSLHRASGQGEAAQAYERIVLESLGRAQPFQPRRA